MLPGGYLGSRVVCLYLLFHSQRDILLYTRRNKKRLFNYSFQKGSNLKVRNLIKLKNIKSLHAAFINTY